MTAGWRTQGRKMSKSLGNVVDPLNVTSEYGTDALRYTLATGTTPGQDLNLSMERLTSSRNLTNKLWNATKYVLFGLQDTPDAEFAALADADFSSADSLASLPLSERWIVSRLHACASALAPGPSFLPCHVFATCFCDTLEDRFDRAHRRQCSRTFSRQMLTSCDAYPHFFLAAASGHCVCKPRGTGSEASSVQLLTSEVPVLVLRKVQI